MIEKLKFWMPLVIAVLAVAAIAVLFLSSYGNHEQQEYLAYVEHYPDSWVTPAMCASESYDFDVQVYGSEATIRFLIPDERTWMFNFGDGETSKPFMTKQGAPYLVTHVYKPGTYVVSLIAYHSKSNCVGKREKAVTIVE